MTPHELLDHPALVALLGAVAAFSLCFFVAWCYIAIRAVRTLKILFHMEKLGYKRSPCGAWTWSRTVEILKAADSMPTLGSSKMDAIRQKLRRQTDSPVLGWLTAVLAFLFAVMIVIAAIVAGRAIVVLALLPGVLVLLALHLVVKRTDKSWRCKEARGG